MPTARVLQTSLHRNLQYESSCVHAAATDFERLAFRQVLCPYPNV